MEPKMKAGDQSAHNVDSSNGFRDHTRSMGINGRLQNGCHSQTVADKTADEYSSKSSSLKSNGYNHTVWWLCLTFITNVSLFTRLYKIAEPKHVW